MEELKKFELDIEKGIVIVNGEEQKNITAFSLIFRKGEYGLDMTYDKRLSSKPKISGLFLNMLPHEIANHNVAD